MPGRALFASCTAAVTFFYYSFRTPPYCRHHSFTQTRLKTISIYPFLTSLVDLFLHNTLSTFSVTPSEPLYHLSSSLELGTTFVFDIDYHHINTTLSNNPITHLIDYSPCPITDDSSSTSYRYLDFTRQRRALYRHYICHLPPLPHSTPLRACSTFRSRSSIRRAQAISSPNILEKTIST